MRLLVSMNTIKTAGKQTDVRETKEDTINQEKKTKQKFTKNKFYVILQSLSVVLCVEVMLSLDFHHYKNVDISKKIFLNMKSNVIGPCRGFVMMSCRISFAAQQTLTFKTYSYTLLKVKLRRLITEF